MSSPSPSPSGQPVASNVIATLTLACCAVGLTAAVYWSNSRRSASPPSGGRPPTRRSEDNNRHSSGGGGPDDVIAESLANEAGLGGFRGGSASVAGASVRQALPVRNYFTRCAERHVRRHTASLMEWFDDYLGVHIPFSPILFAVQQEERQAPLVLLSIRYLRQEEHSIAITIEETQHAESAAQYMAASLEKLADCAQILSTGTTRIGNTPHPQAEYCYVDESNALFYTLAIFVTHERLAITVQYTAGKRVSTIVPTAFSELVRSIRFTPAKASPSYVLVSEPRLGFGLRLPLDFTVTDSLRAAAQLCLARADERRPGERAPTAMVPASGASSTLGRPAAATTRALSDLFQQHTHSLQTPALAGYPGSSSSSSTGGGLDAWAELAAFMVAAGRGARGMAVLACHEPASTYRHLGPASVGAMAGPAAASASSAGGPGTTRWSVLLERHVHTAMASLGLRATNQATTTTATNNNTNSTVSARQSFAMPRLRAKDDTSPALDGGRDGSFTVRPYRLVAPLGGNFASAEDDATPSSGAATSGSAPSALTLNGSFFVEQVFLTPTGLGALLLGLPFSSPSTWRADQLVPVFWSCFYLGVGEDCVAVHFIAPCAQYAFQSFVELSTATVNSVSLGNHCGQGTAATYCSLRHDLLPFTLKLRLASHETVEEPLLGDPVCTVRTWLPRQRTPVTVLLRTFPVVRLQASVSGTATPSTHALGLGRTSSLTSVVTTTTTTPAAAAATSATTSTPSVGRGSSGRRGLPRRRSSTRVLEHVIRTYLGQLPDSVSICQWERTTVSGMPALRFCYEMAGSAEAPALATTYVDDANVDAASAATSEWLSSRALTLEEEVGSMNPLSTYYRPPAPPAGYLGLTAPPSAEEVAATSTGKTTGTGSTTATNASAAASAPSDGARGAGTTRSPTAVSPERTTANGLGGSSDAVSDGLAADDADLDEDAQAPLRVAVALCYSGSQAMLFSAAAELADWRDVSDAILSLAARFSASSAVDA